MKAVRYAEQMAKAVPHAILTDPIVQTVKTDPTEAVVLIGTSRREQAVITGTVKAETVRIVITGAVKVETAVLTGTTETEMETVPMHPVTVPANR